MLEADGKRSRLVVTVDKKQPRVAEFVAADQ